MTDPEQFTANIVVTPEEDHKTATLRGKHTLHSDEPEWLPEPMAGNDEYPAPVDFLLMSLTSCQVSVLKQCLEKNGVDEYRIECNGVIDEIEQADEHPESMPKHTALRISHITVKITLYTTPEFKDQADECLTLYDEGCIVGQSLTGGIDYTPLASLQIDEEKLATN